MFGKGFRRSLRIYSILTIAACFIPKVASAQKSCGQGQDFEMIFMLDFTGSSSADEVKAEKDAVISLVDYFSTTPLKPRVALGTFNTTAKLEVPLTSDYNAIKSKLALLPQRGSGGTLIKTGLEVARMHFAQAGTPQKSKYIMLISDGQTGGVDETKTISKIIKDEGTFIFAIHYPVQKDSDREIPGTELMRDFIASKPATGFYHTVQDDLPDKVRSISINIGCEDGIACTTNVCNLQLGVCEAQDLDGDGDGVKDCSDKCPNQDDSKLRPEDILVDDDGDGVLTCRDDCPKDYTKITPGFCGCDKPDDDADGDGYADCLRCSASNLTVSLGTAKTQTHAIKKAIAQFAKRMKKFGSEKAAKKASKIKRKANKLHKEALKLTTTLPSVTMSCRNSRCTEGIEFKANLERLSAIHTEMQTYVVTLYKMLAKFTGPTPMVQKLYTAAVTAISGASGALRSFPDGVPQCTPN